MLCAAWVAPVDQPIVREGGVVFENGTILAVGDAKSLRAAHPDAGHRDLGDAVILPGLVNAHTHLELSHCAAGDSPGGTFGDWILSLPRRIGRESGKSSEELFVPAVGSGVEQSLRFGVTSVGDIAQQMHLVRPVLRESAIRSVSYGEVIGLGGNRDRYAQLLPRAVDRSMETARLRIGLTPHAPYTVDLAGYQECLDLARREGLPLATHLAETPAEREFADDHAGELRGIWERLGHWHDGIETLRGSTIRAAHAIGLLDYPTKLAHVNYCDDDELKLLSRGNASVVYCPRTHRYFGHPPHRWREMLARGINVAVGTDSCASSPDLNLVDDLRLMHEIAPEIAVETLWEMATLRGARAISQDDGAGSIAVGKAADFAIFDGSTGQPLQEILESGRLPREIWIAGEKITRRTPADGSRAV
jgi:cytosine/adenosine deaminase-related metal-dependent hydrolase